MAEIKLHGKRGEGKVALCDDADYALLSQYRWHVNSDGYVRTYWRKPGIRSTTIQMHLLLIDEKGGRYKDHRDGNKLDNRRANLRPCTQQENSFNRRMHRNNKSGYKGVVQRKGKWAAFVHKDRRQTFLGLYDTPELAAAAYNGAARALFGAFARLNVLPLPEVAHASD